MKIFFVQFFCVFWPLFLISSASVRSLLFLSIIEPIFVWNVSLVSVIFLKRSLVLPILLFYSISLHWSLRKASLSLLVILWNSAFKWVYLSFSPLLFISCLFTAICKASSDSHFAFFAQHMFLTQHSNVKISIYINNHNSCYKQIKPIKWFLNTLNR